VRGTSLIAALACLALLGTGTSEAATPTLYFQYASDCSFQIVNDSGGAVTTIAPGFYQVAIDTPSAFAGGGASCPFVQFDLTGPGVSIMTTLGEGDAEFDLYTVTLQPGATYTAQDDGSPARTRRTFATSATGTPTPVAPVNSGAGTGGGSSQGANASPVGTAAPKIVARGTLSANVTARGKVTLMHDGKPVQDLVAGRYTVVVLDHSPSGGFDLQALKSPPITVTSAPFVGKKTKSLILKRGQWIFYSSFVGQKTYFLVSAK
jgi:hypothetical protein